MATERHTSHSSSVTHHHLQHRHHHIKRHRVPSGSEDEEIDEELDPRIQVELEKLNRASEEINRLELELDDARAAFRQVLSDSTQRLNGLAKKLGACVEKARPYYDARMKLKEAHLESQKAALRFERACSMHEAAKEMVQLAEEGYKRREEDLDPTWQEMLNHATMKVNDAERERIESEGFHQQTTLSFKKKEEEVQKLQKDLKRVITKSKPYFEMKAKFNQVMEDQKRSVSRLEEDVQSAKSLYSQALRSLEAISDDIHRQRLERQQQLQLGVRGAGVGAEAPSPPPSWDKDGNIDGSAGPAVYSSDLDEDDQRKPHVSRSDVKGIVRHEVQYRKRESLSECSFDESQFRTDPLNVAVFKTSNPELRTPNFHAPSVLSHQLDRPRNASYREAIESGVSQRSDKVNDSSPVTSREAPLSSSLPTPGSVLLQQREQKPHVHTATRISPKESKQRSPTSYQEVDYTRSSLSRAQEWVNRSPIPQQRRFVKSQSLIEVPLPGSKSSIDTQLSEAILNQMIHRDGAAPPSPQKRSSPVAIQGREAAEVRGQSLSASSSPRGPTVPVDQYSPKSGSPSIHRKSPKLQGLILRVDAAGFTSPSGSATYEGHPKVITASRSPGESNFVSTSRSGPGQPLVVTPSGQGHDGSPNQQPVLEVSSEHKSVSRLQPSTPTSIPTEVPTPSIMSKIRPSNRAISKTAPCTLSTSYQLQKLSPPGSSQARLPQVKSPTPTSPSSVRSDTLSATGSHKAVLLKVPSEHSSDTESIASTGPMLDDEQVEFLTLDFTEQSIAVDSADDREFPDYRHESQSLQRGHWARMSLPPRLSYLEGFLERARHMSGNADDDTENHASGQGSSESAANSVGDPDKLSSPEGETATSPQSPESGSAEFVDEKDGTNEVSATFSISLQGGVKVVEQDQGQIPEVETQQGGELAPQQEVTANVIVTSVEDQASEIIEGSREGTELEVMEEHFV